MSSRACANLLSVNYQDYSATFAVGPDRWEYFLPGPIGIHDLEVINKRSALKALNYAKKHAVRQEKLDGVEKA